ncbi:unnamed protein product [Polarella glacialis]|uniref:Uncharacterized protein n=1 Tax=Polarella glacialis TaxID=89957 RepID=A0A813KGF5_POLGL|nr:unnamed protein product [Polarella glacialis]CAE8698384.1 unnamed protein product [Polarella glacialis]
MSKRLVSPSLGASERHKRSNCDRPLLFCCLCCFAVVVVVVVVVVAVDFVVVVAVAVVADIKDLPPRRISQDNSPRVFATGLKHELPGSFRFVLLVCAGDRLLQS